jgi:hypothetical protein
MTKQQTQSLNEFLYNSDYLSNLNESICANLKDEAEKDGDVFDLNNVYWSDRFYVMRIAEIKSQFSSHGVHL